MIFNANPNGNQLPAHFYVTTVTIRYQQTLSPSAIYKAGETRFTE